MKVPLFNVHDVALFITATLCLLLAFFQFFNPDKNRIATYFLVVFLIDIAIGVCAVLMLWQPAIKIQPIIDNYVIPYILFTSMLLKGPLLYGYVCAATTPDYRVEPFDIFHLMPIVIYFVLLGISGSSAGDIDLHGDKLSRTLSFYEWHSVKIIPLIYALMAVHKIFQHRQRPFSVFLSGRYWLAILVGGALFNWAWSFGTHLLGFYLGASIADKFGILDNYITSGLISALLVYSLINTNKKLSVTAHEKNEAPLPTMETHTIEKIVRCMEEDKLFLNPRLNIERMAEHINVPYREVSALINKHFQVNFNEYINLYRINEAKRLLSDIQFLNVPINEIYNQAGFNSRSAFHRFFNRLVGVSPSEFRKLASSSM